MSWLVTLGPLVIASINVVDPARDRLAKHGDGRIAILRRPEHARSGKLHGAIAHPVHATIAQRENATGGNVGYVRSPRIEQSQRYHVVTHMGVGSKIERDPTPA